jgi:WhiB family redox-sensing transcriptional regulator
MGDPLEFLRTSLPAWASEAACLAHDPEAWFGDLTSQQHAKAICADCPVRVSCLAHALTEGEDEGVWGGLDPAERRTLRRAHRRAAR